MKLHFSSVGKHAIKWLPAADRNHVNTSWSDTVKCLLDAGKSPIFRSQSLCTYIYVLGSCTGRASARGPGQPAAHGPGQDSMIFCGGPGAGLKLAGPGRARAGK